METESNIIFKSNVYPVKKEKVEEDKEFIGKIWDYNRLYRISQSGRVELPTLQKTIVEEKPYCALNKEDPCWGMVKSNGRIKWECRCTKTSCQFFTECRKVFPYSEDEKDKFAPLDNYTEVYEEQKNNKSCLDAELEESNTTDEEHYKEPEKMDIHEEQIPNIKFSDLVRKEESIVDGTESVNVLIEDSAETSSESEFNDEIIDGKNNGFVRFKNSTQEEIITEDSDSLQFIDAGPGTGKTYTLIQKLEYMVDQQEVDPENIVVLCFTNAAVNELKSRLLEYEKNGASRALRNIDIRTFHSFSWCLISQANEGLCDEGWIPVELNALGYDKSIKTATEISKRFSETVFGLWEHFIVDEVQDLTGILAEFVLQIIQGCMDAGCGITLMGDACQAIYDYDERTNVKSKDFYDKVGLLFGDRASYRRLTENRRQNAELSSITSELREAILSGDIEKMKIASKHLEENIPYVDKPDYSDKEKTSCLLFRNNGQTLKFSSDLRKQEIGHILNVNHRKSNYAFWIAEIFENYNSKNITKDDIKGYLDEYKADIVWGKLQKIAHSQNDILNVRTVLNAVADYNFDDGILKSQNKENLIVSNIHKAKGREYDEVYIDHKFLSGLCESGKDVGEYKTLYVAITRPKSKLYTCDMSSNKLKPIEIYATKRRRWGKYKKNKQIMFLEFDSSNDLNISSFACADINTLKKAVIGDAIYLKRINSPELIYDILLEKNDEKVGELSGTYIEDFKEGMSLKNEDYIEMPCEITDLYVAGVYSQVVDSEYLESHSELKEKAPNGVLPWIDIVGLGCAKYDVY